MTFTRIQKQEAYKKLSDEVKDFIMDNETTELVESLLIEAGLSETERESADTEVFNSMLGLQDFSETVKDIASIAKKSPEELTELERGLEEKIFREIENKKKNSSYTQNSEQKEKVVSNNIGDSFEEIILNQAIAMQPAVESSEQLASSSQVPENLPTGSMQQSATSIKGERQPETKTPNYSQSDPYREPIE